VTDGSNATETINDGPRSSLQITLYTVHKTAAAAQVIDWLSAGVNQQYQCACCCYRTRTAALTAATTGRLVSWTRHVAVGPSRPSAKMARC